MKESGSIYHIAKPARGAETRPNAMQDKAGTRKMYFANLDAFVKTAPALANALNLPPENDWDALAHPVQKLQTLFADIESPSRLAELETVGKLAREVNRNKRKNGGMLSPLKTKVKKLCTKLLDSRNESGNADAASIAKKHPAPPQAPARPEPLLPETMKGRQSKDASAQKKKILVIDDMPDILNTVKAILTNQYTVYCVTNLATALSLLAKYSMDLILLDIEMPDMDGYEAIKRIKADSRFADIPVIFLTAKSDERSELEGFDLGAAEYISKPCSAPLLMRRIANQLLIVGQRRDLKDYADNLAEKVLEKTAEVINLQNAVLATVADLVEFRDRFTGGHISRTRAYLQAMTEELIREGAYADEVAGLDMDFFLPSSQLHDVGKIAITDLILNKPGMLTQEEFEVMKNHVTAGVNAIEKIMANAEEHAFLRHAVLFAGAHHEKWDGNGYPKGLKGKDIPLEGRLMAIADVYDALISVRPYKLAFSHDYARKIIVDGAGTHFDPVLVEVFKKVEGEFERIEMRSKTFASATKTMNAASPAPAAPAKGDG